MFDRGFEYASAFLIGKLLIKKFNYENENDLRCVKSVRVRSNSGPHFSTFGLNTETVFSQNAGKCGPE